MLSTILGLVGLVGLVLCVGHIAGPWWGGLLASLLVVIVAFAQHINEQGGLAKWRGRRP